MGSRESTGLHFVVSNGVEKPDPELRKLIRSHVMLGKNQGKKLPPRKRKTKTVEELSCSSFDRLLPPASDPNESHVSSSTPSATTAHPEPVLAVTIPRKLGSGMSTISFADSLEPGTIEVVLQRKFNLEAFDFMKTAHRELIKYPLLLNRCCSLWRSACSSTEGPKTG
jgi:hypothetical protein